MRVNPRGLHHGALLLCVVALLGTASSAYAVDGVIEINQTRANAGSITPGDNPGFPVTINQPGSYRLTGNLVVSAADVTEQNCDPSGTAGCVIDINSSNVSLDLNGFEIEMVGQAVRDGVFAFDRENVAVENGAIRGAQRSGISVGPNSRIEKIRGTNSAIEEAGNIMAKGGCIIRDNLLTDGDGGQSILVVGDGCTIEGNTLTAIGEVGIFVQGDGCTITGNSIANHLIGIQVIGACTISHNAVTNAGGVGIDAANGSLILANSVRNTGSANALLLGDLVGYASNVLTGGQEVQVQGGIEIGTNLCGTDTICP